MAMDNKEIISFAKEVVVDERDAISKIEEYINDSFADVVNLIYNSKGRLIITGIGKSAIIANKIVATLNSTGTPAVFMHAADAIHGDLGIVQKEDIVLCISKSGNSPEIKVLIPYIKNMGNIVIGMVGNADSFLASNCNYMLYTYVEQEACPNNLAPTSSTTAQLVMGDALAMTLLKMRGFTAQDFAKFHPGGALGKKLYTHVGDIMQKEYVPLVDEDEHLDEIIIEITSKRMGAAAVKDKKGEIIGIITDGDLRRMLLSKKEASSVKASDIMSYNPKTINASAMAIDAYKLMNKNEISQLIVFDEDKRYIGIIHVHDLLREGVV